MSMGAGGTGNRRENTEHQAAGASKNAKGNTVSTASAKADARTAPTPKDATENVPAPDCAGMGGGSTGNRREGTERRAAAPTWRHPFKAFRRFMRTCSIKTAFFVYSTAALLVAAGLSCVSFGLLGLAAERTLGERPFEYMGVYLYDADQNALVPADSLSWYENAAVIKGRDVEESPSPSNATSAENAHGASDADDANATESAGSANDAEDTAGARDASNASNTGGAALYVESFAPGRAIPIDNPPEGFSSQTITDMNVALRSVSRVYDQAISLEAIPAYDRAARLAQTEARQIETLRATLPENAEGRKPLVSTVGYHVSYAASPDAYQIISMTAVALVPVIFALSIALAGRMFYRHRLKGPIEAMEAAARKIAAGNLDFTMADQGGGELGQLCAQFETMRSALDEANKTMWRAAESRRKANAALAHDLRTPLTVIKGQADLLRLLCDMPEPNVARMRESSASVARQSLRLESYVDSMRTMGSLEETQINAQPMNPKEWFERSVQDARVLCAARHVAAEASRSVSGEPVSADAAIMARVMDNLVSNAVRHAKSRVRISLRQEGPFLTLRVEDDGEGLSDDALLHAAEPFWRGKNDEGSRTTEGAGTNGKGATEDTAGLTYAHADENAENKPCEPENESAEEPRTQPAPQHFGLGLFICTTLCEKHGGSLTMENAPDGGARITATFNAPKANG